MRIAKYIFGAFAVGFLGYNSVYFKKLDDMKASKSAFNVKGFAADFWDKKLPGAISKSIETGVLFDLLQRDKNSAFTRHGRALGIGNIKYFLIKGAGIVGHVGEDDVTLKSASANIPEVKIETEFIFGNAVRDASGLVDINAFENSMDFNNVSAEINQLIRDKVVRPFKSRVKKGDRVEFVGAMELNQAHPDLEKIELIPLTLNLSSTEVSEP